MIALAPAHPSPDAGASDLHDPGPTPHELDALGDRIARLAAHLHAVTFEMLELIREFDEREGWRGGFRSCAHWLSWRTGFGPGTAREKVRVARALSALPRIGAAMARGELSFSKVRALTRVATPENEADLLELARNASAAQTERLVRAWRRANLMDADDEERRRHERRRVSLYPDEDGSWVLRGRLDPEVGALLEKALEWATDELYRRASTEEREATTQPQRRADALGLLAERAVADGEPTAPHRFQVVLHVEADEASVLADSGIGVPAETSRRLSCDAGLVQMTHDREGQILDVGRKTRTVPTAIRRALEHRDRGCRFPGCGSRHAEAHHVQHWAGGGETKLDNLVLLCRFHHRAVHEEGFGVELLENGEPRFRRPDGRDLPPVPNPPPRSGRPSWSDRPGARAADLDPWTAGPRSFHQDLDLGLALDMLRTWPERSGRSTDPPAAPDGG